MNRPRTPTGNALLKAGMLDTPEGVWRVVDGKPDVVAESISAAEDEAVREAMAGLRARFHAEAPWLLPTKDARRVIRRLLEDQ